MQPPAAAWLGVNQCSLLPEGAPCTSTLNWLSAALPYRIRRYMHRHVRHMEHCFALKLTCRQVTVEKKCAALRYGTGSTESLSQGNCPQIFMVIMS
jgi:hypothetical protein